MKGNKESTRRKKDTRPQTLDLIFVFVFDVYTRDVISLQKSSIFFLKKLLFFLGICKKKSNFFFFRPPHPMRMEKSNILWTCIGAGFAGIARLMEFSA